jgi:23S rRNA (uracil1939-C5)-methyltransferase
MKRVRDAAEEIGEVIDLAHDGRGVVRIDGKTVFVADALPGETVTLRRTFRHRSHDEARLERVIHPADARVEPACPHFGACGGCALQHLAADAQLSFKQSQLLEALARIGNVQPGEVLPPLLGPVWNYRRRARLGVKSVARKGRVLVGFRERAARFVADLHECRVLQSPVSELIDPLAELVQSLSIAERLPQVEVAVADNGCALVLRVLSPPTDSDFEKIRQFGRDHGLHLYLQPGGPATIEALDGAAPPLYYELPEFDIRIEFEPTDFLQVNGALNRVMVSRAVELLQLRAADSVLDLFCGLGNFSLPLARHAGNVVGVEGDAGLVERAARNARRNSIDNAGFHAVNLAQDVATLRWARNRYDLVLLDPPRAGAREVLPVVAGCGARRLMYISCHPGSLARDAGILVNDMGFRLVSTGVMDMFPHTAHVEAMAVFDAQ